MFLPKLSLTILTPAILFAGVLGAEGRAGESEPGAHGGAQQEVHPPGGDGRAEQEGQLQDQRDAGAVRAAQPQAEEGLHEPEGRDRGEQQGQGRERGDAVMLH